MCTFPLTAGPDCTKLISLIFRWGERIASWTSGCWTYWNLVLVDDLVLDDHLVVLHYKGLWFRGILFPGQSIPHAMGMNCTGVKEYELNFFTNWKAIGAHVPSLKPVGWNCGEIYALMTSWFCLVSWHHNIALGTKCPPYTSAMDHIFLPALHFLSIGQCYSLASFMPWEARSTLSSWSGQESISLQEEYKQHITPALIMLLWPCSGRQSVVTFCIGEPGLCWKQLHSGRHR